MKTTANTSNFYTAVFLGGYILLLGAMIAAMCL